MADIDHQSQRQLAVDVVTKLRAAGHEALWAGGCVRDLLLQRPAKDYDVATSAKPDEVRELFGRKRTLPLGAAFGVITVLGPRGAGQIEVATFREDAGYSDGRRPDAVTFSTAKADAQRRDFTINGLFYDPAQERVIDYVGGEADLKLGVIRAIGDPAERIAEDKLRVLRAARFAARFEFVIDEPTAQAIRRLAGELPAVSVERIAAELRLMLVDAHRARAVELLADLHLLPIVAPEVFGEPAQGDEWRQTLNILASLVEPSFELALAAIVRRRIDRAGVEAMGRRLKFSNYEIDRVGWLVERQGAAVAARATPWPKLQRLLVTEGIEELLALDEAVGRVEGADLSGIEHCRQKLALPRNELNPPPLITGDDLVRRGVPRGKIYQTLLEKSRDAQLNKEIRTHEDALKFLDQLLTEPSEDT